MTPDEILQRIKVMITEADLRNNEVVTSDPAAALRALYAHTDAMRDLRDDVARAIGAKR